MLNGNTPRSIHAILTMTEHHLLTREKEFHRLNKQLDEETKELMKEIDLVAKSKEETSFCGSLAFKSQFSSAFDNFYADYPLQSHHNEKNNEQLTHPLESTAESILPPKPDNSKNDAISKILQKKIEDLMIEIRTIKDELKKKTNSCKDLELENQKICAIKDKFYNHNNLLKETIGKLEAQVNNLQLNSQEQVQENGSLKKEIDSLKKEGKLMSQQLHQMEIRLNRSLEDNEKLRSALKCNKMEEKELRDEMKKLRDNEKNRIRKIDKQKCEILQSFKKQILLVDNLKKQKALLEVGKQINLTQQDLSEILGSTEGDQPEKPLG